MAKNPRAGELTTANYGWTKPTVGASVDVWGDQINTDLDGIDSVVHGIQTSVPAASTTTPLMDGTAAIGAVTTWAKADHVHPTDTSRASVAAVAALPVAMNDNRIINGDMRIDQRNNGASGATINGYTADRWTYAATQASKGQWQRVTSVATGALGFPYALGFASNSAYTPVAADYFNLGQAIEADTVSDFAWGTPNAQPVIFSFYVSCTMAGTFGGTLRNYAGTRSYPFTYSIPTANTVTKIAIPIPGDTGGTWVMSGNGGGVLVGFDLGSGATFRGSAGSWQTGNFLGATGAVNLVATNGATFLVTGVKLEVGSVATPFNRQSLAKSMADCQRYYQFLPSLLTHTAYGQGSVTYTQNNILPVQMRAAPTAAITNLTNVTNAASGAVGNLSSSRFISQAQVEATGQSYFYGDYALTAEL